MNISPVQFNFTTPRAQFHTINNKNSIQKYSYNLNSDTVSFSGKTIKDCYQAQYETNMDKKYKIQANQFRNILFSIANDLSEYGISFDKEGSIEHALKKPDRLIEKVESTKTLDIRDKIRFTMFMSNPYDTDIVLNKFLPAMADNGYVLAQFNDAPDIDFRLGKKAQPSGYEDIQMRFEPIGGSTKTPIELIILFGPNYQEAKDKEHKQVYEYTREFSNLNMDIKNAEINTPEFQAKGYIDMIKNTFRNEVSKKLYENAKNKDYYHIDATEPIIFDEATKMRVDNYFNCLRTLTNKYYNIRLKQFKGNKALEDEIKLAREKDLKIIKTSKDGLTNTMELYGADKSSDNL